MTTTAVQDTIVADLANAEPLSGTGVAVDWQAVVASDAANQPGFPCRALRANVGGVVAVYTPRSQAVARLMNFNAGETRYGVFMRVLATGTTATGLEAGS